MYIIYNIVILLAHIGFLFLAGWRRNIYSVGGCFPYYDDETGIRSRCESWPCSPPRF